MRWTAAEERRKLKKLINLLSAYYIRAARVMKHNSLGTEWYGPVANRVCKIKCEWKKDRGGERRKETGGWGEMDGGRDEGNVRRKEEKKKC
jgi:hypothetical protein